MSTPSGPPPEQPRGDQTVRFDRSQLPPPGEWGKPAPGAPPAVPPPGSTNPGGPPAFLAGPPPAPTAQGNSAGPAVAVLGLGTLGVGLFGLPLNDYGKVSGDGASFYNIRSIADAIGDRGDAFSALAEFWWLWGAYIAGALAVVLVAVLAATASARLAGWLLAVLAVAGGVVHGVAMAQSFDYRTITVTFGRGDGDSFYDHPGNGIWVSLAGFAALAVGGLVAGLSGRRR